MFRLVLLRRFVTFEFFESFVVVTGLRLCLSAAAPVRPVQDMVDGDAADKDELAEQATDFVAAQRDERAVVVGAAPFCASLARVTARNAAAAIARVMWAYQAS